MIHSIHVVYRPTLFPADNTNQILNYIIMMYDSTDDNTDLSQEEEPLNKKNRIYTLPTRTASMSAKMCDVFAGNSAPTWTNVGDTGIYGYLKTYIT